MPTPNPLGLAVALHGGAIPLAHHGQRAGGRGRVVLVGTTQGTVRIGMSAGTVVVTWARLASDHGLDTGRVGVPGRGSPPHG
ncbi:MAG TPA: hypothetical protein VGD69_05455 [Herpetosiphonaceae bacterium]